MAVEELESRRRAITARRCGEFPKPRLWGASRFWASENHVRTGREEGADWSQSWEALKSFKVELDLRPCSVGGEWFEFKA